MPDAPLYRRIHRKSRRWKEIQPQFSEQFSRHFANGLIPVSLYTKETNGNYREGYVRESLDALACVHLELGGASRPNDILQLGCDAAMDFFFSGFWKKEHSDFHQAYDKVLRHSAPGLLMWFHAFHAGLIQCLLAERWEDVTRLADWAEFDLVRDCFTGKGCKDEQVADVYLLIASSLRKKPPMPGVEQVIARIEKCRDKWPELLLAVWRAVEARDQEAFDAALVSSLTQFTKEKNEESFAHWLALPETALVHTAMHFGLKFPDLPDGLEDYIITRQSLGLDP